MKLDTLSKFACGWRDSINKPFTCGDKTYATDGFILVRLEGNMEGVREWPDFPSLGVVEESFTGKFDAPLPLSEFRTEEEKETCPDCQGTGTVRTCPECEGSGEVELDTGYNYYTMECESCNGRGTLSDGEPGEECEYCEGTGQISARKLVVIGQGNFDNRLINKLIGNLPKDTTISPSYNPLKPAVLKWEGGEGLIMPVRC